MEVHLVWVEIKLVHIKLNLGAVLEDDYYCVHLESPLTLTLRVFYGTLDSQ